MSPEKITAMLIADFMWRRRCIYGRGGFGGQPRLFLVKGLCSGTVARSPIAVNNHRLFSGATYRWWTWAALSRHLCIGWSCGCFCLKMEPLSASSSAADGKLMTAYFEVCLFGYCPEVLIYHRALNTFLFIEFSNDQHGSRWQHRGPGNHCYAKWRVLTVSELPGFEDNGRAGASLLSPITLQVDLSPLREYSGDWLAAPKRQHWGIPEGGRPKVEEEGSKQVWPGGAP